jgi:putative copper export protein
MAAEPLIHWPEPITEFLGFVGLFLADGAIGYRYAVLRGRLTRRAGPVPADADPESALDHVTARRASVIGLIGVTITGVLVALALPESAASRHLTVGGLLAANVPLSIQVALVPIAAAGFAWAAAGNLRGWPLAAFAVIGAALRAIATGSWSRLVNPLHMLAGGLWIGTLFVLVCSALAMSGGLERARRDRWVAARVAAFSPLALGSAAVLATMGVITGWRHLGRIDALWTTPYGATLIVKLMLVACVLALGAWNWRRQRPALGQEGAVASLRHSATLELTLAAAVLVVTAVLVSLPSPNRPG